MTPALTAQHAEALKLLSAYYALTDLIDLTEPVRGHNSPEAQIDRAIWEGLHQTRANVEPVIERLAREAAEAEALEQEEA